jgi:hypothetical protein
VGVEVVEGRVEEGSRKCKLKSRILYSWESAGFQKWEAGGKSSEFSSVMVCERIC